MQQKLHTIRILPLYCLAMLIKTMYDELNTRTLIQILFLFHAWQYVGKQAIKKFPQTVCRPLKRLFSVWFIQILLNNQELFFVCLFSV